MEDASREGPGSVGAGFFADMRYLNRAKTGSMTSSSGTDTNPAMSAKAPIADNARSVVMTWCT